VKRVFVDASNAERCTAVVTLKDKTTADCGRRSIKSQRFCWQHGRIYDKLRGINPTR
jgi:hypothetical protein